MHNRLLCTKIAISSTLKKGGHRWRKWF